MSNLNLFGQICSPHVLADEVERLRARFPEMFKVTPPMSPSDSLPTTKANDSHSEPALIYVNSITGDGS